MSEIAFIKKVITSPTVTRVHEIPTEKHKPTAPIGIFDSGVGGLSVLKEVMQQLPQEDVIYLGDTARVPFGSRPPEEILTINREIFDFMKDHAVKMVMIACGTSSSIAQGEMKKHYKFPIVDIIHPGAKAAVEVSAAGKIGVIATETAIKSGAFQSAIRLAGTRVEVFAQACPLFVPLVEGGFIDTPETKMVAKEYLKPLLQAQIDTLVLGCTHYPHLSKILKTIVGPKVMLVDPAKAAVVEAKNQLAKLGLAKDVLKPAYYQYFVTGTPMHFQELGSKLLGKPIMGTKQVVLGG